DLADQGPGAAYNADAKFFTVYSRPLDPIPDLRISHLGYDRKYSSAEDPATWLPVRALQAAVVAGRIGSLAADLIGVPTNRSQRVTMDVDAEAALAACIAQNADLALLVPS
ncbi:MAG: glycine reductase, partial [Proteobacteria bacterium]|nr:glycine reductase [Pseudomonadota bacterium]